LRILDFERCSSHPVDSTSTLKPDHPAEMRGNLRRSQTLDLASANGAAEIVDLLGGGGPRIHVPLQGQVAAALQELWSMLMPLFTVPSVLLLTVFSR